MTTPIDTYTPGEQPTQPIHSYHARTPIDTVREALERVEAWNSDGAIGDWDHAEANILLVIGGDLLATIEAEGQTHHYTPAPPQTSTFGATLVSGWARWAHRLADDYVRRVGELVGSES